MSAVVQLAEMVGASWALWRLSQRCYRPRLPRDARDLHRWPVEQAEAACRDSDARTARSVR